MLGNNIEQTTTTTGTGTINLDGSVSGADDFSEHFVSTEKVPYILLDGNSDNWEEGVGVFTDAAPDTLARTVVLRKNVAGTISDYPATGITLAGTSTVLVGPSASMAMSGNNSGAWTGLTSQLGEGKFPANVVGNVSTLRSRGNLDTPFHPAVFFIPTKITKLGVKITTVDAGNVENRCAIYEALPSGLPGRVIVETGDINTDTTGEVYETLGTPIILPAGIYFFCHKNAGTTLQIYGTVQSGFWNPFGTLRDNNQAFPRKTLAAGAFPDPAPTSGYAAENGGSALPIYSSA